MTVGFQPEKADAPARCRVDFDDNSLLVPLFGEHHQHLASIEQALDVSIASRGNRLVIEGTAADCGAAEYVLQDLYGRLKAGGVIEPGDVDGALRMIKSSKLIADGDRPPGGAFVPAGPSHQIRTRNRVVSPRSVNQARYIRALQEKNLTFGIGPAGTGKTYLAVAMAVSKMLSGDIDRIILSRPAVEAGERLGFLPGDMREKVDPYLRPLYDALYDMMPAGQVEKRFETGQIEIAPLAFMRGRTLANAYIILDEAQNTTPMQMKMFLTRFGENSRMVVAGDDSQVDLPSGEKSGLFDAHQKLRNIPDIAFLHFDKNDVVRHPLVGRIVEAYDLDGGNSPNRVTSARKTDG